MDRSRIVSEFSLREKHTPPTLSSPPPALLPCSFCAEHLAKVTELRKREIVLQLQNQKLKEEKTRLERERDEIINNKVLTYNEYRQRQQMQNLVNQQDLEAELFQAKMIIELLLVSKGLPAHPQIKQVDVEALKQKYSDLLLENLRLQQKVMIRDRIIQERTFFPIYHYDQRVTTLRKALVHWYRKAEEECQRMRMTCRNLKLGITHEIENMRQIMNQEIQVYKKQLAPYLKQESSKSELKQEGKEKKGRVKDISTKVETKKMR